MKLSGFLFVTAALFVLPAMASAQTAADSNGKASPPAASTQGARQLDLPKAVERDSRVQSNGKAWGIRQAAITDPSLPRVLLIGDSILNGYLGRVTRRLEGKAYVDGWVNPFCQSESYNAQLEKVLTTLGPYDVVHFNMGLHGFQRDRVVKGQAEKQPRIPEDQFEPLTRAFVEVIKRVNPKAKIIWASTTPISLKEDLTKLDPVQNPIIEEHNRLVAKVMGEMQVPVNDFYTLMCQHLDLKSDGFHWKDAAKQIQGNACADAVLGALSEKAAGK